MGLAEGIRKPLLGGDTIPSVFAALIFSVTLSVATAAAQVVTGQLGSPNATTTVDGKQLPASPQIGRLACLWRTFFGPQTHYTPSWTKRLRCR